LANDSVVVILFLGLAKLSESHKITNEVSNVYIQLGKQEKIYYEIEYYVKGSLMALGVSYGRKCMCKYSKLFICVTCR
jgi:hypothetical protein